MLLKQPRVALARSGARKTGTRTGLFLLREVQGRVEPRSGALHLSRQHPEGKLLALAKFIGVQQFT